MSTRKRYWMMKSEPDAFSIDDLARVVVDHFVRPQQVRERSVAIAGGCLGRVHLVVDPQLAPREPRQARDDPFRALVGGRPRNETRRGDRTRVDERVGGPAGALFETDGVEGLAARLDTHVAQHLVASERVEGQREHEGFRDRLDRERVVVAERDHAPARVDDGHPEPVGVGRGEFGDVLGGLTGILAAHLVEHGREQLADRIHVSTLASTRARRRRTPGVPAAVIGRPRRWGTGSLSG